MTFDKKKLIKLLNLTTSDQDGEAMNALRLATKMMKESNLSWDELLNETDETVPDKKEDKRQYAKGYRAGFKKGYLEGSHKAGPIRRPPPYNPQNVIWNTKKILNVIDDVMVVWDKLNAHEKHIIDNCIRFIHANRCLPMKHYDYLVKISKTRWDY